MRKSILYISMLFFFVSCKKETERLTTYSVHGLDVSHYQSKIDWDKVAANNIEFVFVKASEGEEMKDSLFARNWNELQRVDITRGAYHFFRPTLSVAKQACNFIESADLKPGDLPPVLDVEVTNNASSVVIVNRVRTWLEIVETHYNIRPIIYTNLKFYETYLGKEFADYPIWIARYNYAEPNLSAHDEWVFWQYGNRGQIAGIDGDVDFNVFYGTAEELEEWLIPPPLYSNDVAVEERAFLEGE